MNLPCAFKKCPGLLHFTLLRMVSWMAPNHKVIQHSVHVVLQNHVTNKNHISSSRVTLATKLGRLVIYFERLQTIKSFYALIACSCKVMWQTRIIIYAQPESLWLQTSQNNNLPWWAPTYKVTLSFYHVVLQENYYLKSLYLH